MAYTQKIIKCNLSVESIDKALKQLANYKKRFLKCQDKLMDELAKLGYETADSAMPPEGSVAYQGGGANLTVSNKDGVITIGLHGQQAVFIEFGSGLEFNGREGTSSHPHGQELGYTIGSWSLGPQGAGQIFNPDGWFFYDNGDWVHTWGNPTYMPLGKAEAKLTSDVMTVVRKVFGSL